MKWSTNSGAWKTAVLSGDNLFGLGERRGSYSSQLIASPLYGGEGNMPEVKSKIGLHKLYKGSPAEVRNYFEHLPSLVDAYPLDVALSYVFAQVELAQNATLYCGVVKLHKCESSLARSVINTHHMTRNDFQEKFEMILAAQIPARVSNKLKSAEKTRDRVMHGKNPPPADKHQAVADVLSYSKAFNDFAFSTAGFRPFGSLQGHKGAGKTLDKKTTRWVLKGMGFAAP